jgi:hypothetical protein
VTRRKRDDIAQKLPSGLLYLYNAFLSLNKRHFFADSVKS